MTGSKTKSNPTKCAGRSPLTEISSNIVSNYREDSPSTLQGDDENIVLTPMSSASNLGRAWSDQEAYDSDGTDFLIDVPETPCPRGTTLYEEKDDIRESRRKPESKIRQPNFGRIIAVKHSTSTKKSLQLNERQRALEDLKNLEYTRRHSWTDKQRCDLAVLFGFFEGDAADLTKVFNKMHGLDLDTVKQVKPQEKYLRDNAEAFPICHKIFTCPLDDPNDDFSAERAAVIKVARSVGVVLQRREGSNLSTGSAKSARSRHTRRRFKLLMRKARFTNDSPPSKTAGQDQWKLGGIAIPENKAEEHVVDLESDEVVSSTPGTPRNRPQKPSHLAFRVWDKNS